MIVLRISNVALLCGVLGDRRLSASGRLHQLDDLAIGQKTL
jgi:hypothetical protein